VLPDDLRELLVDYRSRTAPDLGQLLLTDIEPSDDEISRHDASFDLSVGVVIYANGRSRIKT
jgi:hypothetical protein